MEHNVTIRPAPMGATFRIYTQDLNLESILKLANDSFTGYNVTKCMGAWEGVLEKCLVLEVIEGDPDKVQDVEQRVMALAENIRALNEQDSVLVTSTPNTTVAQIVSHLEYGTKSQGSRGSAPMDQDNDDELDERARDEVRANHDDASGYF